MQIILAGGIVLAFVGILYILPIGIIFINNKALSRITGSILLTLGIYLIFRALTL